MGGFLALLNNMLDTIYMRSLLIGLSLLVFIGCSSAEKRAQEFNNIEMGMSKSKVLEVAGPPHWSDRQAGMDRWIYYLKPEQRQTERVVYFRHGQVFQKGQRIKPLLSADELDQVNTPRAPKVKKFKPSMSEAQVREAIKKEMRKQKKKKKTHKFESI